MAWPHINPKEKETIFRSEATSYDQIETDLKTVVDWMLAEKEVEGAAAANQLFFDVNATNGYGNITWWDKEASKALGAWTYELILEKIWEAKIKDASDFDSEVRVGFCCFTESHMVTDEGNSLYNIYLKTELDSEPELLLV